jgi:flagellar basal-body rod protein FlgF
MMDKMLYIAMSGAKQNMRSLAVNAHNLANAKTIGFKADLAQARAMQAFGDGLPSRVFSMTERSSHNFDSGGLVTTGRGLDISINGEGWIAVETPTQNGVIGARLGTAEIGQVNTNREAYTRFSQLKLSTDGVLETANGYPVIGEGGIITIPLPINNIQITSDGVVMIQPEGAPSSVQEEVGRIKFVNPDNRALEKGHDGLFRRKDGEVEPADVNVKVSSGTLESSNVNPVSEMTEMISLQRQFEMQLKLMKAAEEIDSASAQLLRAF